MNGHLDLRTSSVCILEIAREEHRIRCKWLVSSRLYLINIFEHHYRVINSENNHHCRHLLRWLTFFFYIFLSRNKISFIDRCLRIPFLERYFECAPRSFVITAIRNNLLHLNCVVNILLNNHSHKAWPMHQRERKRRGNDKPNIEEYEILYN